jgi:hypothetical protein
MNKFKGHFYNLPKPGSMDGEPYIRDRDGNILPTQIRRYSFADEYTYRI